MNLRKTNWIYTSLIASVIAFFLSLVLVKNWKLSIIICVITFLITLTFNPVRRYMKICLTCLSLLVTTNIFSLNFAIKFLHKNSLGELNTQLGTQSIVLTIALFLGFVFFGFLDFHERNNLKLFDFFKSKKKEGYSVSNIKKVKKQINIKENKGKIEM